METPNGVENDSPSAETKTPESLNIWESFQHQMVWSKTTYSANIARCEINLSVKPLEKKYMDFKTVYSE